MINFQIYPSPMTRENRIFRAAQVTGEHTGWDVYLVGTLDNDLPSYEINPNGYKIIRFCRRNDENIFTKIIFAIHFLFRCCLEIHRKRPDVINLHSLSTLPLVLISKYLYGATIVYDTHELETETKQLKGFRKIISKLVEGFFIKFIDGAIFVNATIQSHYVSHYKLKSPVCFVHNTPIYKPVVKSQILREKLSIPKDHKIFLYQGILIDGRSLPEILGAFESGIDGASLIIMGYGPLEDFCKSKVKEGNNIYFHKAVQPNLLHEYTCSADIGILSTDRSCLNHEYSLPNKFFEYLIAGLPVMSTDLIEPKKIIQEFNCGYIVEKADVAGFRKSFEAMALKDISKWNKTVPEAVNKYKWDKEADKLKLFLNQLVENKL